MLRSFHDKETERIFRREFSRRLQSVAFVAKRKLDHLAAATSLADLAAIPGNQLETLKRERTGQHSIRVNDQFRICFRWQDGDAYDVEVTDYH